MCAIAFSQLPTTPGLWRWPSAAAAAALETQAGHGKGQKHDVRGPVDAGGGAGKRGGERPSERSLNTLRLALASTRKFGHGPCLRGDGYKEKRMLCVFV